ncbi:NHL repeat protein [Symmachiella dynata]|uniref:NHL repeat protein n=1 Tax=Symmachiella dynata TaxID=2527995 RepID=A0A517ZTM3_9PLAN|nr:twin-arginine translocation signal domain-containing protein [Symmachiella dynata]QDU45819.1 NHL repeat protein [Symmachiella dynata]
MSSSQTPQNPSTDSSRRDFLKTATMAGAAAAAVTTGSGPLILNASDKAGSKRARVGQGEFVYECDHHFGEVPDHVRWGDTHGVCVDEAGLIYVKHRQKTDEPMDAIVVFDADGKFVRSFGKEYHGGGHGIDVRKEGGEEFLYLSNTSRGTTAKTTLTGEQVWVKEVPQESGKYDNGEKYSPTNICFGPDGGFYIGDGYGSSYLHQYDKNDNYVRTWGGKGREAGEMSTPHGQWLDNRAGRDPSLVVADRANGRMQYFTLDGKHIEFMYDVLFPADVDIRGDILMVPDLHARISLFDKNNTLITHLGDDAAWRKKVLNGFKVRQHPEDWQDGKFIHPHDAAFDHDGNIYVAEWVPTGRISFLRHVG